MKKCTKCSVEKKIDEFHSAYDSRMDKTYTYNYCKECYRERQNKWRRDNPEKNTRYALKWQRANKEKWNRMQMDGYYRNHDHRLAQGKEYNEKYCKEVKEKYGISRTTLYRNGGKAVIEELLKNWKCKVCGTAEDINIHHKDNHGRHNQKLGLKLNNSINNLEILCRSCHSKLHTRERIYGKQ